LADLVFIDGNKVESIDWSLAGGMGLFSGVRVMTTMLAIGAYVIELERHLARLIEQMELVGMGQNNFQSLLHFDVEKSLINQSNHTWARVRIVLFNDQLGKLRRLVSVSPESSETIQARRQKGLRLYPCRDASWMKGGHVKTGLIGIRQVQLNRAKSNGFDDVLWINGDGEIAESTWSNVFLIGRTGDLVEIATPAVSSGLLQGITKRRITELLETAKIPVTERIIAEDEIPRFDEAFVTSSIQGLIPVTAIGSHRLHTLRPNAIFNHIARLYQTWLTTQLPSDSSTLAIN
jgi:branched-subunit amino acid aminotransferase/4-amino-4-deoxychorismate lyase